MGFRWLIFGLILGVVAAAAALFAPSTLVVGAFEGLAPQLQPADPGRRALVAAALFAIPTLIGLILSIITRPARTGLAAPDPAFETNGDLRDRAAPELQLSGAEMLPADPVPEPHIVEHIGPAPAAPAPEEPASASFVNAFVPTHGSPRAEAPETAAALARLEASVRALAERGLPAPAIEKRLAVIEAALGDIPATNSMPELIGRLEELEHRVAAQLSQIAAQLAEIAATQRAQTRTPPGAMPAELALPAQPPPRPRDPMSRRRLADAAAALRASLGETAPE